MRKFLSTVLFMLAVLCGKSQILLNEIYVEPGSNNSEFFELYNASIDKSVNLNCYTLVTFYYNETSNKNTKIITKGFYVLDLPNTSINPKSYFVGAPQNKFNVQGNNSNVILNKDVQTDLNWNALPVEASLKKYESVSNVNNGAYTITTVTSTLNDFFVVSSATPKTGVFLFDDNGIYVDGFMFSIGSSNVPDIIKTMTSVTSSCGKILNFASVTSAGFVNSSGGSDNGFARTNDGNCGTWQKTANADYHTPKRTNLPTTNSSAPSIISTEYLLCGKWVNFNLTDVTGISNKASAIPITVQLYIDANKNGILDAGDSKVLDETGAEVKKVIDSYTLGWQELAIPSSHQGTGESFLLVYESQTLNCLYKYVRPLPTTNSLNTTQISVCGQLVDFTISGATNDPFNHLLPITVELHYDLDGDGVIDDNNNGLVDGEEEIIESRQISSYSSSVNSFTVPNPLNNVILVYKSALECLTKTEVPRVATGTLSITETNICGKKLDIAIVASGDAKYAFPITVKLFYSPDQQIPVASQVLTTINPSCSFINLDASKTRIIVYEPTYNCFTQNITKKESAANLGVGGEISPEIATDGTRKVNYFLEFLGTTAEAFPLALEAWEDVNKNGILDSASTDGTNPSIDKLIGRETIESITDADAFQKFEAYLSNPSSYLIVKATSAPTCSYNKVSIANTYVPLPVHFQSFHAARNKEKKEQVVLKWVTATEQNNRGFNVQRKVNGQWKNIAFVFSQADNGNSNTPLAYEYKDINVSNTVTQYQIQQVDYDGKTSYSDIKAVVGLEQKKSVVTYPNPGVDGKVNLLFSDLGSVKEVIVSDLNGRIVKQFRKVTENNLTIDGLQSGFYTIKITDQSTATTTVEKVIIR